MEYLSENTVMITDKSSDATLFYIDYGYEGNSHQGSPQTKAIYSYLQEGSFNLTQTAENICGFTNQVIPVEIQLPNVYNSVNVKDFIDKIPFKIETGENLILDISELSQFKTLSVKIKTDSDTNIIKSNYTIDPNKAEIMLNTSNLSSGIHFLVFEVDGILLTVKKILVQ